MPDIATQIVVAYEEAGLTPEEIAADLEMDVTSVKLALAQNSRVYKKALGQEVEVVSDAEVSEMHSIIKSIAVSQQFDNPGVALKAAKWIIDEKKGRNDAKVNTTNKINVVVFNEKLASARERMLDMKRKAGILEPIEV